MGSSASCALTACGSAARSNTRRTRAMIVGSADNRENRIATKRVPGGGLHRDKAVHPAISIVRAYRSFETTSTPGMARALRNATIVAQS